MTAAPWSTIGVADGSANFHRFTRSAAGRVRYVYVPVTPEQSSSGLYSGGAPREEDLAANDPRLVELWALVRTLEADTAQHTAERAKGTGAISWDQREFIVKRGAALDGLLAVLARFGN